MDASYDFQDCMGLKVKPRKGDGLLFYSLFPNATIDPVSNNIIIVIAWIAVFWLLPIVIINWILWQTSLHGSCPVIKGVKWVATKWIRDQEQDD